MMNEQILFVALLVVLVVMMMHKCRCDHEQIEGMRKNQAMVLRVSDKALWDRDVAQWSPTAETLKSGPHEVTPAELQERLILNL